MKSIFVRMFMTVWLGTSFVPNCYGQESAASKKELGSPAAGAKQEDPRPRHAGLVAEFLFDAPTHQSICRQVMFSPDERVLATWTIHASGGFLSSTSWCEDLQLRDVSTQQVIWTASGGQYRNGEYCFDNRSQRFVCFDNRTCFVWIVGSGKLAASLNHPNMFRAQFLDDGRYLATMGYVSEPQGLQTQVEVKLRIWNTENWEEQHLSLGSFSRDLIWGFDHLDNRGRIIFGTKEGAELECWDVIRDQKLFTIDSIRKDLTKAFNGQSIARWPNFCIENGSIRARGYVGGNGVVGQVASVSYDLENGRQVSVLPPLSRPEKKKVIGTWMYRSKFLQPWEHFRDSRLGVVNEVMAGDGVWEFWNESTGQVVRSIDWQTSKPTMSLMDRQVSFDARLSSESNTLALFHESPGTGVVNVFNTNSDPPKLVATFTTKFPVESLALSPDRKALAVVSSSRFQYPRPGPVIEGEISILSFPDGGKQVALEGDNARINAIAFSPDGRQLAGGARVEYASAELGHKPGVKIWDTRTGALQSELSTEGKSVYSIAFSPDMKRLAAGSSDSIFIWELASRKLETELSFETLKEPVLSYYNGKKINLGENVNLAPVRSLKYRGTGALVSAGCYDSRDDQIVLWNLSNRQPIYMMPTRSDIVVSFFNGATVKMRLTPDQNTVLLVNPNGALAIDLKTSRILSESKVPWLPPDPKLPSPLSSYGNYLTNVVDFDHQANHAIAVYYLPGYMENRGKITIHDAASGKVIKSMMTDIAEVKSVIFDAQDRTLIVGGKASKTKDSNGLTLWDLETNEQIGTISDQSRMSFEFVSKGDLALSRDLFEGKHSVNLWQLSTGKKLTEFEHEDLQSFALVVSPNENLVATIGPGAIKVWDLTQFRTNPQQTK